MTQPTLTASIVVHSYSQLVGQESPLYVSLQHGILVCSKCAEVHKTLGPRVSEVRFLRGADWEEEQYLYLKLGGNQPFKEWLEIFDLLRSPLPVKYRSKAASFYRAQVRPRLSLNVAKRCRVG
jgi:hypothetical protein